jgi:hypothetical protein
VRKFRKKPVVIHAKQITEQDFWDNKDHGKKFMDRFDFMGSYNPKTRTLHEAYLNIETLEGTMKASLGDWVIIGLKGELYPCKPDIFEATYEAV